MKDLDALKKALHFDEGLRLKAYPDSKGIWTIGIGHNLEDCPLSQEAVDLIFKNDIETVEAWLTKFPWYDSLDSVRQNVVLNMGFTLGETCFKKFVNFIGAVKEKNWANASEEMLESKWASDFAQLRSTRAKRLAQEMLTGKSSL